MMIGRGGGGDDFAKIGKNKAFKPCNVIASLFLRLVKYIYSNVYRFFGSNENQKDGGLFAQHNFSNTRQKLIKIKRLI